MAQPTEPPIIPRFRLRTLGTLALAEASGTATAIDPGSKGRRLALLAVLAASGDRGRSRDQLMLLFWPDASQSRARHSLEQLLYAIRGSMGADVFTGVNPVRLNPMVVATDVGEFEAALERGDLETATALYQGRFLDGFYLSDSPELEQWLDMERARLERSYVKSLETLATQSERAGDNAATVRWREKLVDADPVSSRHTMGLMKALMDAGDHAAALRHAERHHAVVAKELGTSVGPAVAALASEARALSQSASLTSARAPADAPAIIPPRQAPPPSHPVEPQRTDTSSHREERAHAPRRAARALSVLALLTILAVVMWLRPRGTVARTASPERRMLTSNVAASDLYQRGNDPALLRSDSTVLLGLRYFEQAISLDSGFAAAYAGMSRMHARIAFTDVAPKPPGEHLRIAEQAARTAVALDDSLAEAHGTLAVVAVANLDFPTAERAFARAIELDPTNARYREWRAQFYAGTDRPVEALADARRAVQLDPLSPTAHAEVARALMAMDRCDEALAELDSIANLRPPLLRAAGIAAECHARQGDWKRAIAELRPASTAGGLGRQSHLAYMLARAGEREEARRIYAGLLDRWKRTGNGAYDIALVLAGLGETDEAFTWLYRSIDDRTFRIADPPTLLPDEFRRDPRFNDVRARLGLQKR